MNSRNEPNEKGRGGDGEQIPRDGDLRSFLAYVTDLLNQLQEAVQSLPHVGRRGNSNCPFADELYAKKDALEQQVSSCMARLAQIFRWFEKEVERCQKNLEKIRADSSHLSFQETREKYSEAEQKQELELRRAINDRDATYLVLKRAQALLKVSRKRKMPKGDTQEEQSPDAPSVNSEGSRQGVKQPRATLDRDLNALVAEPSDAR